MLTAPHPLHTSTHLQVLRVWDRRGAHTEGLSVRALSGHGNWVSSIAWSTENSHQLASAGHDGCVKVRYDNTFVMFFCLLLSLRYWTVA